MHIGFVDAINLCLWSPIIGWWISVHVVHFSLISLNLAEILLKISPKRLFAECCPSSQHFFPTDILIFPPLGWYSSYFRVTQYSWLDTFFLFIVVRSEESVKLNLHCLFSFLHTLNNTILGGQFLKEKMKAMCFDTYHLRRCKNISNPTITVENWSFEREESHII